MQEGEAYCAGTGAKRNEGTRSHRCTWADIVVADMAFQLGMYFVVPSQMCVVYITHSVVYVAESRHDGPKAWQWGLCWLSVTMPTTKESTGKSASDRHNMRNTEM